MKVAILLATSLLAGCASNVLNYHPEVNAEQSDVCAETLKARTALTLALTTDGGRETNYAGSGLLEIMNKACKDDGPTLYVVK